VGVDIQQFTVIAGLGGRPITMDSIRTVISQAIEDCLEPLTFLDLKSEVLPR
jgi:pyruvate ferredoxin oxidoreductase alpha subunit